MNYKEFWRHSLKYEIVIYRRVYFTLPNAFLIYDSTYNILSSDAVCGVIVALENVFKIKAINCVYDHN